MDLLDSLLEDTDVDPCIHFSPDPKCWGYEGSKIGTTPKDLIASRLAMPTQAAIFDMDSWLSSATREKWNNPERAVGADEKIPRGFFKVDMREWRKVVRRAHRAGLFVPINANVSPSHMAAGAFPVPKDPDKDRFIGDRRPRNFIEASIGKVGLPYAPRLRRILLRHKHGLSISIRDIKNFFPILGVKKSRLHKQVIGPRVPLSWLDNISDVKFDDVDDGVEEWMFCDMWSHKHVDVDENKYVQIAVAGVIQGDLNAVYVAEECHRNFLISKGILDNNMLLMPGKVFPRSFVFGDVYIDDLVVLAMFHFSRRGHRQDIEIAHQADRAYATHDIPINSKTVDGEIDCAQFWGCEVRGIDGTLAFPMLRRLNLMALTLVSLCVPVSGHQLQRLLGAWNYCCSFRREYASVLGRSYTLASKMPPQRKILLGGPVVDELLTLCFCAPFMFTNLRAQPCLDIVASDASSYAGGACVTRVSENLWHELYDRSEEAGEYVRLDWGADEPASELVDHRSFVSPFCASVSWRVICQYKFRYVKHINILEAESLLTAVRWIVKQGYRSCRCIFLVDSRVLTGAVCKGRSSSIQLNYVLRKLAGYALTYDLYYEIVWVQTEFNPADAPSRFAHLYEWYAKVAEMGLPISMHNYIPGVALSDRAQAEMQKLLDFQDERLNASLTPCLAVQDSSASLGGLPSVPLESAPPFLGDPVSIPVPLDLCVDAQAPPQPAVVAQAAVAEFDVPPAVGGVQEFRERSTLRGRKFATTCNSNTCNCHNDNIPKKVRSNKHDIYIFRLEGESAWKCFAAFPSFRRPLKRLALRSEMVSILFMVLAERT